MPTPKEDEEVLPPLDRDLWHATAPLLASEPVAIIGDVHGCADELRQLLALMPPSAAIIMVGDIVNKGPKSVECLHLIRRLQEQRPGKVFAVRGNHEQAVLAAWTKRAENASRYPEYAWTDGLSADDIAWIRALPFTLRLPDHNAVVVHAGLLPNSAWSDPANPGACFAHTVFYKMRDVAVGEGGVYRPLEEPAPGSVPWARAWSDWAAQHGGPHVYFGHDAKRRLQLYAHATGLDTGCLYGFHLSACLLPDRTIVQVPAAHAYEPPGRSCQATILYDSQNGGCVPLTLVQAQLNRHRQAFAEANNRPRKPSAPVPVGRYAVVCGNVDSAHLKLPAVCDADVDLVLPPTARVSHANLVLAVQQRPDAATLSSRLFVADVALPEHERSAAGPFQTVEYSSWLPRQAYAGVVVVGQAGATVWDGHGWSDRVEATPLALGAAARVPLAARVSYCAVVSVLMAGAGLPTAIMEPEVLDHLAQRGSAASELGPAAWLDLVATRRGVQAGSRVLLTGLRALADLPTPRVCVQYDSDRRPVYRELEPWTSAALDSAASFGQLPASVRGLVVLLENILGAQVECVELGDHALSRSGACFHADDTLI